MIFELQMVNGENENVFIFRNKDEVEEKFQKPYVSIKPIMLDNEEITDEEKEEIKKQKLFFGATYVVFEDKNKT